MSGCAGSLDTNALLRLVLADIPAQRDAVLRLLGTYPGHYFSVPDIAIIEFVFVVGRAYGFSRQQASEAVHALTELAELQIDDTCLVPALELYVERPALSFEDCYMSVFADVHDRAPLWTFDAKLVRQADNTSLIGK